MATVILARTPINTALFIVLITIQVGLNVELSFHTACGTTEIIWAKLIT